MKRLLACLLLSLAPAAHAHPEKLWELAQHPSESTSLLAALAAVLGR